MKTTNNLEIDYINGLNTSEIFGRSKYQREIHSRLSNVVLNTIEYDSIAQKVRNSLSTKFQKKTPVESTNKPSLNTSIGKIGKTLRITDLYIRYPYLLRKKMKKDNIKHITSQELAYLLKVVKLKKVIVTCYDLIPWIYENNHSLIWRLNIMGMKRADRIITISEFSKSEIVRCLDYPEDRIDIIYPAIDHNYYYKKRDKEILKRFNIPENKKVILYVGSEMPRQNIPFLLKSFSNLKKILPDVKLLKVGNSQWQGAREELTELIRKLDLQKDVIFAGYVKEDDLPKLYNASDLFVYPSLYSGWSLPLLEAMACGTSVITSNVSVFPEVVGNAGITVDPYSVDRLAGEMFSVLTNNSLREYLVKKGIERANMFSWNKSAKDTLRVYKEVYRGVK